MRTAGRLLLTVLVLAGPGGAHGAPQEWPIHALAALRAVRVHVEPIAPDAVREGLRASTLLADLELRVRRAGLMVVTRRPSTIPGTGLLRLRADVIRRDLERGPYWEYTLTLELVQTAALGRDTDVVTGAVTWQRSLRGIQLTTVLVNAVRDGARDLMEKFLDDYLAASEGRIRILPTPVQAPPAKATEGD
jgi:hypothetical protein